MSEGLLRIAVCVPVEHAEEARARALELAPGGFEEAEVEGGLTLVFYATAEAAEAIEAAFPGARTTPVDPGWEDGWRSFHRPARAAVSGSARRGSGQSRASPPS